MENKMYVVFGVVLLLGLAARPLKAATGKPTGFTSRVKNAVAVSEATKSLWREGQKLEATKNYFGLRKPKSVVAEIESAAGEAGEQPAWTKDLHEDLESAKPLNKSERPVVWVTSPAPSASFSRLPSTRQSEVGREGHDAPVIAEQPVQGQKASGGGSRFRPGAPAVPTQPLYVASSMPTNKKRLGSVLERASFPFKRQRVGEGPVAQGQSPMRKREDSAPRADFVDVIMTKLGGMKGSLAAYLRAKRPEPDQSTMPKRAQKEPTTQAVPRVPKLVIPDDPRTEQERAFDAREAKVGKKLLRGQKREIQQLEADVQAGKIAKDSVEYTSQLKDIKVKWETLANMASDMPSMEAAEQFATQLVPSKPKPPRTSTPSE